MRFFESIERRAGRLADPVEKLRLLRAYRGRRRWGWGAVKVGCVVCVLLFSRHVERGKALGAVNPRRVSAVVAVRSVGPVWVVEESAARRVYSNGLIVRGDYATESVARRYRTYAREGLRAGDVASAPAGIVFHTTESLIVPLAPAMNQALRASRESVLAQVRRDRLYNFVIDRFGQVYGVVPEGQVAFHAGHSVWADAERVFLDLNESFLGVSFEAQTDSDFQPSSSQVHAGRLLTEVLRGRYGIAEANCVTHAQVSVNPDNMRLGYHTDWGSRFPFRELGLEVGYAASVAAVRVFGFQYDDVFLEAIGGRAWDGLAAAEEAVTGEAAARGLTPVAYRKVLQDQYRQIRRQRNERAG